ncbi:hypothetical protein DKP78_20535, partial [Enterococcus faecium]
RAFILFFSWGNQNDYIITTPAFRDSKAYSGERAHARLRPHLPEEVAGDSVASTTLGGAQE